MLSSTGIPAADATRKIVCMPVSKLMVGRVVVKNVRRNYQLKHKLVYNTNIEFI